MNYEEFKEGINILISSFPTKNVTEEKTKILFETYFADQNFESNIWVKACKIIGGAKSTFPVPAVMKATYWEVAKEKKPRASHTECSLCSNGLRSYFKKKNGTRYTYAAICDCELGSQYSPKLGNNKNWATWSEKEKQGKFVQHEKETIPEFIPFTDKYAGQEVPF